MAKAVRGTDWSEEEASLCVETYFEYLTLELSGQSFVKSHLYRALSDKIGRTPKSIEMKFQNISAVLDVIGREWIRGLPPLANYQQMLAEKISQHIGTLDNLPITPMPQAASAGFEDMATFVWELPPTLKQIRDPKPDYIERLARQFDPVDRDMRNRDLGAAGEEFVFKQERQKLSFIGRKDLADNVRWVSKEEGDGAGYDILSFSDRGEKRFIEVKTTVGGSRTPFFVSRNEYAFSCAKVDNYSLFRLYDFRKGVRGFELKGALDQQVALSTEIFRADFNAR